MLKTETEPKEVFLALAVEDIRDACDVLRPEWDDARRERPRRLGLARGRPATSRTTREGTIEEAKRLHALVDRPNLFIKIPATQGGPARDRGDDRRRHPGQRDADLLARAPPRGRRGLHPRRCSATPTPAATSRRWRPSRRSSSRASTPRPTSGSTRSAATTSSRARWRSPTRKLAYQTYKELFAGDAWEALAAKGASRAALPVGVDVDQEPRLPRRALRRGADRPRHRQHDAARDRRGVPGPRRGRATRSTEDVDGARRTLEAFAAAGIDYDDVVETLEREGVEKFAKSFEQLFADVDAKRERAGGGRMSADALARARPAAAGGLGPRPAPRPARATPRRRCRPPT